MAAQRHPGNGHRHIRTLHLKLPASLWAGLEERQRLTGEPIAHIVRAALADALQVEHHTLYQVSTSTALVEGIYRGAVTVGQLLEHGDFGLGTFDGLDGEMVICDGRVLQVRADGSVREAAAGDSSPFALVTRFEPEQTFTVAACDDLAQLQAAIDPLRASANVFYAIRVDGAFAAVHTRAMCRTDEGVPLVEAAAHQPEFHLREVRGTMVGFWAPPYARALEVPGYHLHFVTAARDAGGHVLDCSGRDLRVQIQEVRDLRVALPANEEFLRADLTRDPAADLARAESKPDRR
ncbi:MAG TPA: acetolactate decarboxylase [Candidatus Dormibacteraeota bacterium]|nr:acetolactate decarboxylase [Candidatus Dormibacteraeota bacterium]